MERAERDLQKGALCSEGNKTATLPASSTPLTCSGCDQIKSLLLSHHHSTSALVSEILMSVLQTVQKNNRQFTYGQYIFTDCTEDNVQNTHTYTHIHIVYYKDILNYQRHIIHRMGTSTLCTVSISVVTILEFLTSIRYLEKYRYSIPFSIPGREKNCHNIKGVNYYYFF